MRLSSESRGELVLLSPTGGEVICLADVPDPVFAEEILGKGFAIIPTDGTVRSPIAGVVEGVLESRHAIYLTGPGGTQILVHVGLETVQLNGEHLTSLVNAGDTVSAGQPLIGVDLAAVAAKGFQTHIPVCLVSAGDFTAVTVRAGETVTGGEPAATARKEAA